jgi:spore coat polysaccharide biosynthesis protein SpsF (cytidylyltransferase family)
VRCFRGHEEDVVRRLHDATARHEFDYVISATADCPFVDPDYADEIVAAYERTGADLTRALDLPLGAFSYGLKPAALARVVEIKDDEHTEVWGRYFTETGLFQVHDLPIENPAHRAPHLRMTLDYPEDFEFFKAVFAALYQPGRVFSLDEILAFLAAHPEVVAINSTCMARYQQRIQNQGQIRLKPGNA